ncbi:MAG: sigma-70 family RNA polymerase sigma factor [Polyangiaceae bacterium]|nr:sigma-70 family RNA polymerase sigma factor [Polyangiaceae bacterium]
MNDLGLRSVPAALAGSGTADQPALTVDQLMTDYAGTVWRLLRRLGLSPADADDATQQVFMIASRKLELIGTESARSFLCGTALRVASNARRARRRLREVTAELDEHPSGSDPEAAAELVRARDLLDQLLGGLSPKLRRALVLAEIEELEVEEIARLESIPVGTAASRLRLAREAFRSRLTKLRDTNPFRSRP